MHKGVSVSLCVHECMSVGCACMQICTRACVCKCMGMCDSVYVHVRVVGAVQVCICVWLCASIA